MACAAARALRGAKAKTNFGVDSGTKPRSPSMTPGLMQNLFVSATPVPHIPSWASSTKSTSLAHRNYYRSTAGNASRRASEFMSHPPMQGVPILQQGPPTMNHMDGWGVKLSDLDPKLSFRGSPNSTCSSLESTQEFQFSPDHSVISTGFSSDSPSLTSSPWQ